MNHWLSQSFGYLETKSPRERYLLLLVVLAGFISVFYTFVLEPQQARLQAIEVQNQQINNQIQTTERELDAVAAKIRQFEVASTSLVEQEQELQQRLVMLQQQVAVHQRIIVKPSRVTEAIEQLFKRGSGLELVRFVNHPGVELFRSKLDGNALYKHRFTLEFLGNYESIHEFLNVIDYDRLPVNFESFYYVVEQYPKARVTLVGYTLSRSGQFMRFEPESGK